MLNVLCEGSPEHLHVYPVVTDRRGVRVGPGCRNMIGQTPPREGTAVWRLKDVFFFFGPLLLRLIRMTVVEGTKLLFSIRPH